MHMVQDIALTKECQLCAKESNRKVIKIPFFLMYLKRKKKEILSDRLYIHDSDEGKYH